MNKMLLRIWLVINGALVVICHGHEAKKGWSSIDVSNDLVNRYSLKLDDDEDAFDCEMRATGFRFAMEKIGGLSLSEEVILNKELNLGRCREEKIVHDGPSFDHIESSDGKYTLVDETRYATIEQALGAIRSKQTRSKVLHISPGTHFLNETINLFGCDAGIKIVGLGNQTNPSILSGGINLGKLNWNQQKGRDHIVWADLSIFKDRIDTNSFNGLFINGERMIRARFPNGNPEKVGLHTGKQDEDKIDERTFMNRTGYIPRTSAQWIPQDEVNGTTLNLKICEPTRDKEIKHELVYPNFHLTYGGAAESFQDRRSFWDNFQVPRGLDVGSNELLKSHAQKWKNAGTGYIFGYHGLYWGNWMFEISSVDKKTGTISFGKGGFQEGRGMATGAEWFVENILEELDDEGEWFFDSKTYRLYLWPPKSISNSLHDANIIAAKHARIISIHGSRDLPVRDVTIENIQFSHTSSTFMEPYIVPSGGDWSINKNGAVFAMGTEDLGIIDCVFHRTGGDGIFLINYHRNAKIIRNRFSFLGAGAIALLGETELLDASKGTFPVNTTIANNFAREFGIFQKQSGFLYQSLTMGTRVVKNIAFNGPRAGINFNDGMGGDHLVASNFMFNLVRETSDHGVFNSWDRQPYLFRDPQTNRLRSIPLPILIEKNFFIGDYNTIWPIDHDDGSSYYLDSRNVCVYGGSKNYLGHSKRSLNNLFVFPDRIYGNFIDKVGKPYCHTSDSSGPNNDFNEVWANNSCVLEKGIIYGLAGCKIDDIDNPPQPAFSRNSFFLRNGSLTNVVVKCDDKFVPLKEWQRRTGRDAESVASNVPDLTTAKIISMIESVLDI